MQQSNISLNYKNLIEKVSGDLVILGLKDTCKTTLLMHLARTLREDKRNHVYILETFPKWINEFDSIPYLTVEDSDVQPKENMPYLEQDKSIIQWSKDYTILNSNEIIQALKQNKDLIFLIECEDMEKISALMTFVIYQIYRKQYQRAKQNCLKTTNENFYFLIEEAHNLLDSTVIAKKTFNKLRKIQNEFRNLKMHLICVALRLQDLSPKIRSKMSILLAKVSLDDYQLKIRNLLRNSKFRDEITALEKGSFVFPETDTVYKTEPFQQIGKPYEWIKPEKPKPQRKGLTYWLKEIFLLDKKPKTAQPQPAPQPESKPQPETETEDIDKSVYNEDETQDEDTDEDLALLGDFTP
jgi:hypothetical protein